MNRRSFIYKSSSSAMALALLDGISLSNTNRIDYDKIVRLGAPMETRILLYDRIKSLKIMQISDLHLSCDDDSDMPYLKYSKRMRDAYLKVKHYKTGEQTNTRIIFDELLSIAKSQKVDLLALTGDIINYPSKTAVDYILSRLKHYGIPYMYTAGNHDWHYEGTEGTDDELRDSWIKQRLLPLYNGEDPYCHSRVVNGINLIFIDNSTFQINSRQLQFFERERKKGYPMLLFVHIPLYVPTFSVGSCGHPEWGEAVDHGYKVERRDRWSSKGNRPETYAFLNAVKNCKSLLGTFAGHWHSELDVNVESFYQYVTSPSLKGQFRMISVEQYSPIK